ncbi:MAG: HD family phosphohydrolase [Caldisericia bacterium]
MKNLKILKRKIKINRELLTIKLPLFIVIFIFLYISLMPNIVFIRKGTKLNKDLISPRTIEVIDEEATKKEIENALLNAPVFYEYNPDVDREVLNNFEELINYLKNWREGDKEAQQKIYDRFGISFETDFLIQIRDLESKRFNFLINTTRSIINYLLFNGFKSEDYNKLNEKIDTNLLKDLSNGEKNLSLDIIKNIIKPNLIINNDLTEKKRQEIIKSVKPITIKIEKNEVIFKKGTIIGEEELNLLKKYHLIFTQNDIIKIILIILESILITYLIFIVINNKKEISKKEILYSVIIIFISLLIGKFLKNPYLVPIFLITNLLILFFDFSISILFLTLIFIFYSIFFSNLFLFILLSFFISIIFSIKGRLINSLNDFLRIGPIAGFFNLLNLFLFSYLTNSFSFNNINILNLIYSFLNPVVSVLILVAIVPLIEKVLSKTTSIGLVELLNINNPLLKEFIIKAPGSYQHSIIVSTLSQVAADSIGEDPLIAKVCGYYHDIGKLVRPEFFIENDSLGVNPHESISPSLSALIIISHVKEGVELAKKYNLPNIIVDAIKEHHGTSLVSYFYTKAKSIDPEVKEETFRYPGPIPSSKISGIIMLADSVEASVRGERVEQKDELIKFIEDIINSKINDGQLNNSELSFKDINKIKESFIKVLTSIYHERISYIEKSRDIREKK